jgi:hypothetical protein
MNVLMAVVKFADVAEGAARPNQTSTTLPRRVALINR